MYIISLSLSHSLSPENFAGNYGNMNSVCVYMCVSIYLYKYVDVSYIPLTPTLANLATLSDLKITVLMQSSTDYTF